MRLSAVLIFIALLCMPAAAQAFKAALILEHSAPSAFNNLLKAGLARAGADFGIETEIVIAPEETDQTEIFQKTAENASLVIVATDNLHEILRNNAANYRNVMFGSIDAGIRASNIMSVTFADEQAAFLAGVASAMLIKSFSGAKKTGWLAGKDTPSMRSLVNGFIEGAKLVNSDITVAQAVSGSFTDKAKALEKAKFLADANAGIVVLAAGAPGADAAGLLAKSGIWHIDADAEIMPDKCAGVIGKAFDKAVYEIISSAVSPRFRAKEIAVYNLENGGVSFALMNRLPDGNKIPADIARRIKELRHEVSTGAIRIKSFRARTLCDCLD